MTEGTSRTLTSNELDGPRNYVHKQMHAQLMEQKNAEIERLRAALHWIAYGDTNDIHAEAIAQQALKEVTAHETLSVAPFPYPTDRDGWICSMCHGWNQTWTRVCLHSHLPLEHEQHMCTSDCNAQKANERPKCSGTMGCHVHWSGWPTHHPNCSDHPNNRSVSEGESR